MPAPPEHIRAPEVARAALREATDLFGRLLAAAVLNGTERGVAPRAPEQSSTPLPARLLTRAESKKPARHVNGRAVKDYCRAWRERQRETKRALQRDARRAQADLLAPKPRLRPPIGHLTIMELGPDTCRFPFGDGPFLFCGATPVPGKPYCADCVRGLYRTPGPDGEEVLSES